MCGTLSVLVCFPKLTVCRSWVEDKWGRTFAYRMCFGCKMLVQYATDGDSASIVEVLLFPESEGDMDSRFCLLIKLERLEGG